MKWYTKEMRQHDMSNGLVVVKVWHVHVDPAGPSEQSILTIHTIPSELLPILTHALKTIKGMEREIPF